MFVDACAIIAVLSDEREAERVSQALAAASQRLTSPVAVLEAVLGLARPDKFNLSVEAVEPLVMEFLEDRGIEIRDLPPAKSATRFALSHPAMGTILVGMATPQQFEDALAAVEKGPLPQAALDRLSALRQAFSGEPR